ncbi:MAG: geranylgeranylglycerol-phosphate geranylgeranyltransferase [Flavobacteriaceae bacterium]|nr:geranylgeranylglycerol-phosphate geranylgeranyltransferase [Flavobacteriaceae bacterium]
MIFAFFKLIRYKNLLILALCQLLFKYTFLNISGISLSLSHTYFLILMGATLCIAAAGYIINDIYDVELDNVNKPNKVIVNKFISEKIATQLYIAFNVIGLSLGYYLSHRIQRETYFLFFLLTAFSLLQYAIYWKKLFIIKNVLVAVLVGLSVLIVGVFDILPNTNIANAPSQLVVFKLVLYYTFFAFLINLIREIVKDIEDVKGDSKGQIKSIVKVWGIHSTKLIVNGLLFLLIMSVSVYITTYFLHNYIVFIYMITFVLVPAIVTFVAVIKAKEKKHFQKISSLLKVIMLFGLVSITLISLLNQYG